MTGNFRFRSIAAVFVALTLVVAAAGGAAGAGTATIDEETSTTSYESEIKANTVVNNPTNNTSVTKVVTTKVDTNDTKTVITEDNASYDSAVNSSTENVDHNKSGNEDNWHNATFTHGDIALDTEHAPGENVTMLAVAYNNTSMSESDQATGNVTFYLDYSNDTSTEVVTDSEVDNGDIVTVSNDNRTFLSIEVSSDDNSEIEVEEKEVPNKTMYVVSANDTVATDMSDVVSEFDSADKASSVLGLSALGPNAYVVVSDGDTTRYLPVYTEEAGDDAPDAYAVLTEDVGGSTGFEIHGLTEHFDSGENVDVTAYTGDGTPFLTGYITQSLGDLSMTIFASGGSFALIAPMGLARRRDDEEAAATEA